MLASGPSIGARVFALGLVEALYGAGVLLGSISLCVLGGFVPVLSGWLNDEIRTWRDVVEVMGGVWETPSARRTGMSDLGPVLGRGDAPLLFDELQRISRRIGGRMPQQIRLTYLPCCGVTVWDRTRALVLGLPLLHVLDRLELRSVLAHELAHLAHGDATRAVRRARFVEGLGLALDENRERRPVRGPLGLWARLGYRLGSWLIDPVAQGQELRADRVAAGIAGGEATATALAKVAVVQALFREVLDHFDPSNEELPNLYAFFRTFWSRLPEAFHTDLRHRFLSGSGRDRSKAGSHPDLLDRISLVLAVETPAGTARDREPAASLLGDLEAMEQMLHNRLFGIGPVGESVFHRAGRS